MREPRSFDEFVAEGERAPFSGWNFSWLKGRYVEGEVSWNYRGRVLEKMRSAKRFLDMGTGGGEFLSSLKPFPKTSFATEGYQPNVSIARKRLEPLGVKVVPVDSTKLPFEDESLDLIINRHEEYAPSEILRCLSQGGCFLTQQVGARNNIELYSLLDLKTLGKETFSVRPEWDLKYAVNELEEAGFTITAQREEFPLCQFYDVGALVYFLKAVPWDVPDFSVSRYRQQLWRIHELIQSKGNLQVTAHRFLIEATKN